MVGKCAQCFVLLFEMHYYFELYNLCFVQFVCSWSLTSKLFCVKLLMMRRWW